MTEFGRVRTCDMNIYGSNWIFETGEEGSSLLPWVDWWDENHVMVSNDADWISLNCGDLKAYRNWTKRVDARATDWHPMWCDGEFENGMKSSAWFSSASADDSSDSSVGRWPERDGWLLIVTDWTVDDVVVINDVGFSVNEADRGEMSDKKDRLGSVWLMVWLFCTDGIGYNRVLRPPRRVRPLLSHFAIIPAVNVPNGGTSGSVTCCGRRHPAQRRVAFPFRARPARVEIASPRT